MDNMNHEQELHLTCPNCGKQYITYLGHVKGYYLDGMHDLPVHKWAEAIEICDCGMICAAAGLDKDQTIQTMQSDMYQTALNAVYDSDVEKKIKLLDIVYGLRHQQLYYAHYFDEVGEQEKRRNALMQAINDIETQKDQSWSVMHGLPMLHLPYSVDLVITPEVRILDLYRCAEEYDKAMKQLKYLRKKYQKSLSLNEYLKCEKQLIQQKQSNFM